MASSRGTGIGGIWIKSSDRAATAQAANAIDGLLASEPSAYGEEFYGDKLLVVQPLAVTYSIDSEDRTVQILQVWHQ